MVSRRDRTDLRASGAGRARSGDGWPASCGACVRGGLARRGPPTTIEPIEESSRMKSAIAGATIPRPRAGAVLAALVVLMLARPVHADADDALRDSVMATDFTREPVDVAALRRLNPWDLPLVRGMLFGR